ncbi:MAG: AI-2E family transporter [Micavibrio sp.]|nr:AI-2E family transporter [Micavibrio sp.]
MPQGSIFKRQACFWLATLVAFVGVMLMFNDVLLPFVLGMAIAYLLNPLVAKLERMKIGRKWAALIILSAFVIFVFGTLVLAAPVIYQQSLNLIKDAPTYGDRFMEWLEPYMRQAMVYVGQDGESFDLKNFIKEHSNMLFGKAGTAAASVFGGLAAGGKAAAGFFSTLVFTPIIAYFLIKEWPFVTNWAEDKLPREHKDTILDLLKDIDQKISGFVRGQISVAFLLGVGYAVALTIAGLKYGFLIGLGAGVLSIIPMVGSTLGLLVSVTVAWFQSGELSYVGIIAAIFLVGQFLEGNFITPKIVGNSVGLHPLWVFFALLAGGALFGIVGMLIAVPVAAAAGVLVGFAIKQYKKSPFYMGSSAEDQPDEAVQDKAEGAP